jgi:cubilin
VVIAPPGNVVQITWLTFDLEASTDCQYDYVEIFDNSTTHGGKIGRFCGTALPPASTTTENIMTLTFKTDVSSAKLGFSALITFIEGSKGKQKYPWHPCVASTIRLVLLSILLDRKYL